MAVLVAIGSIIPDQPYQTDPTHPPPLARDSGELWRTSQLFTFHHLHLNGMGSDFYARLFDPAVTYTTRFAGQQALQSGPMLMVFSPSAGVREQQTSIWHFGWGPVSSGETYLAHAAREVEWEPPLPAGRLHLHVLSVAPVTAAAWYRDMLGATMAMMSGADHPARSRPPPRPEHRVAQGVISIGSFALAIYRVEPPLVSTRGQRVDHVAVSCDDLDAAVARLRARGVPILQEPAALGETRAAMIEGPDKIAIELVER